MFSNIVGRINSSLCVKNDERDVHISRLGNWIRMVLFTEKGKTRLRIELKTRDVISLIGACLDLSVTRTSKWRCLAQCKVRSKYVRY